MIELLAALSPLVLCVIAGGTAMIQLRHRSQLVILVCGVILPPALLYVCIYLSLLPSQDADLSALIFASTAFALLVAGYLLSLIGHCLHKHNSQLNREPTPPSSR